MRTVSPRVHTDAEIDEFIDWLLGVPQDQPPNASSSSAARPSTSATWLGYSAGGTGVTAFPRSALCRTGGSRSQAVPKVAPASMATTGAPKKNAA